MGSAESKEKGPAPPTISEYDKAKLDVKNSIATLKQYRKKMAVAMERETAVAKQLLKKGDKKGALVVLKKKKMQEVMLERAATELDNVEMLLSQMEFAQINADVYKSMQRGGEALKALNSMMSVEDVEKLLDENAEQMRLADELDQALQQHFAQNNALSADDERDLERQYEQMLEEQALVQTEHMPDAPQKKPVPTGVATKATEQKKVALQSE